jgi:2'-hydroxyisoflavone reductase
MPGRGTRNVPARHPVARCWAYRAEEPSVLGGDVAVIVPRRSPRRGRRAAPAGYGRAVRLLVLGGTSFVGRAIAETALAAGDALTLFTRGRTGRDLFPAAERRFGDRAAGDYAALGTGSWDAVVDVSGYVPRHVREAAAGLDGRVGRYLFISTGSVYDHAAPAGPSTRRLPPERGTEEVTEDTYGGLKVACEDDVVDRFGERATIVRPGIVAGPHDRSDRFTWWVRRAARGGRWPLPARPEQPVQVVDARDLAGLVLRLLAEDRPGAFDAVGPPQPITLRGLVAACAAASGTAVEPVWRPVGPVSAGVPLVLTDPAWDGAFRRDPAPAHAAGMPATPLTGTAAAVLAWDRGRGEPPLTVGLSPEQEGELLAAG